MLATLVLFFAECLVAENQPPNLERLTEIGIDAVFDQPTKPDPRPSFFISFEKPEVLANWLELVADFENEKSDVVVLRCGSSEVANLFD